MPAAQHHGDTSSDPPHVCLGCGCTCDDINWLAPSLNDSRACPLGIAWYQQPAATGGEAQIEGQEAACEQGIERAYALLAAARHPLLTGLQTTTTEAQRAACELADSWGAVFDSTSSPLDADSTIALQTTGALTATWGEVAQRADLVVLWGCDLAKTHPRHFERYSLDPSSPWLPRGKADRRVIVIDDHENQNAEIASSQLRITPGRHYEAFTALHMALQGLLTDQEREPVEKATGVALAEWRQLAERLQQAKFGTLIYGKRLATGFGEGAGALTRCLTELTRKTRWVAIPAGSPGNPTGAINVTTWQTGFPLGVRFSQGFPESGREWQTERLLARGETDLVIVIGENLSATLSQPAIEAISQIPSIVLDWANTPLTRQATVWFRTARPAIECGGSVYRVDGVPLPLRPPHPSSYPTTESILRRLVRQEGSDRQNLKGIRPRRLPPGH